jgi:hypothetical protein
MNSKEIREVSETMEAEETSEARQPT